MPGSFTDRVLWTTQIPNWTTQTPNWTTQKVEIQRFRLHFGQGQERASNFRKTSSRRILRAFFLDTSIDMGVHTYICVFPPFNPTDTLQVFLLWTYYSTSATLRVSAPEHITFQSIRNKCLAVPLREHLYRYERIRFFCQAHCRYSDCGTARFKAFEMRVYTHMFFLYMYIYIYMSDTL